MNRLLGQVIHWVTDFALSRQLDVDGNVRANKCWKLSYHRTSNVLRRMIGSLRLQGWQLRSQSDWELRGLTTFSQGLGFLCVLKMEQGGGSVGDRLLEKDLESPQQDEDPPLERTNPPRESQLWRWLGQFVVAILNPSPQPPVQPPVGGVQDNHDIDIPVDPPEGNRENQTVGNGALGLAIKRVLGRAIELLLLGIAITAGILNVLSFVLPGAFLMNAMKLSQTHPIWIFSVGNDIVWLMLLSIKLEQSIRLQGTIGEQSIRLEQGNIGKLLLHELQHAAFLFHYSYMIVQLPVPPVLVAAGTVLMHIVCKGAHLVCDHYGANVERQILVASGVAIVTSALSSVGPALWFHFLFDTTPKLNQTLLILGMAANLLWAIITGVNKDWMMLAANGAALLFAFILLHYT